MAVPLAKTTHFAAIPSVPTSPTPPKSKAAILACFDIGIGFLSLNSCKARAFDPYSRRKSLPRVHRSGITASLTPFPDRNDEEFVRDEKRQLDRCFSPNSVDSSIPSPPWLPIRPEAPDWAGQIVPASVERNANSVELPLSLRLIKRKKQWDDSFRVAGEAARCSIKRAFSSMVFMIREVQSTALQMREVLFYEDLQGILARVQREMNSSFVWLFQQIFSCTPALMVSVMLLLANFTVYSMDNGVAFAATANSAPLSTIVEEQCQFDKNTKNSGFEKISFSASSAGRTASVGGNGGGGGKVKPVAGDTDDGQWGEKSTSYVNSGSGALVDDVSRQVMSEEEEMRLWDGILEEVERLKASTRDAVLMEKEIVRQLVAPVSVELEAEEQSDYLRTELLYHEALSREPDNVLLLSNFAQFLYVVLHDHNRAEHYFKRAVGVQPADAEALSRYASFLWLARKDLTAAEETYLEAIAADPGNTIYAGNYAHFLWSTGGEETCYPLDGPETEAEADML